MKTYIVYVDIFRRKNRSSCYSKVFRMQVDGENIIDASNKALAQAKTKHSGIYHSVSMIWPKL